VNNIKVILNNKKDIEVEKGTPLYKIIENNYKENKESIILGKVNDEIKELNTKIEKECIFEPIEITESIGMKTYVRTLQFILIKSVLDLYPEAKITIEHSISKGIFGEIHKNKPLCEEDIIKIKNRMKEIIYNNICINKVSKSKEEAIKIFNEYGMEDKVRLLKHLNNDKVWLYELENRFDYFYGPMAYFTGIITLFDLVYYKPGFILRYPTEENPKELPQFIEHKKLAKIFYETEKWGRILDVADVGALNDKVENNDIIDIIRVAEALHEKKIAYIADMINEKKDVKIVLIAGPSSSGKTTFARRLGIQLRVNGLKPISISLDDYFVDRELTPKDENGNYDFESIYALDLKLFNENLRDLLEGNEVEIPSFNFKKGKREWINHKIHLPKNGILVIEGIHGLNEMLTSYIPKQNKFKIYISALTQLNLDNHNRIATTDVRRIRRIVRDSLFRGCTAEETLEMWPSIKRGEEKNIFVFQENADVMFNSTLVYELCILKNYALKELRKVSKKSSVYYEAIRLRSFLNFFKDVNPEYVPENSILREFIGESCFYKK
jgi:uridine kinase